MQSPNNTLIGYGQWINDAKGNVWTITYDGRVAVNYVPDPTTANVTHLAYKNGVVWQENSSNLWWSKTSPSAVWSPPNGTLTVPVPVNASANNTLIGIGQSITDAHGNLWTIDLNGRVWVNSVPDRTTANVTHLAYKDGVVWQQNTSNLWRSKTSPSASWSPPNGTSTAPVAIVSTPSPTLVGIAEGPFMDAHGDVWSINGIQQVECNGVADLQTAHVTHLAYVNGVVWYENSDNLWFSRTASSTSWSPPTSTAPVTFSLSLEYTIVGYGYDHSITDTHGKVWTITADHRVAVNGLPDLKTANVTHLLFYFGKVLFKDTSNVWWEKAASSAWLQIPGISIGSSSASSPEPLIRYGQSITDQHGNIWAITADHRVAVNGVADPKTANVTHLAYVNDVIWFENSSNLWRSKTAPSASWSSPTSAVPYSMPTCDVVLGAPLTSGSEQSGIRDRSGNTWSIINGKVAVDGVVDPTTANVVELAYIGGRIWQENSQGLWWYKTTPASAWSGGNGIASNPIGSTFTVAKSSGAQATINVNKITAMSGLYMPGLYPYGSSLAGLVTTGFVANGTAINASASVGKYIINGDSRLTNGATLAVPAYWKTPPRGFAAENNGTMTLVGSKALFSALSGKGAINASSNSSLDIQSATSGETIRLQASHLTIGGQGGTRFVKQDRTYVGAGPAGGMSFLASITMDNASSITLADTQATRMVLKETGGSIREVLLYNDSTEVADLKISGLSQPLCRAKNGASGGVSSRLFEVVPQIRTMA